MSIKGTLKNQFDQILNVSIYITIKYIYSEYKPDKQGVHSVNKVRNFRKLSKMSGKSQEKWS